MSYEDSWMDTVGCVIGGVEYPFLTPVSLFYLPPFEKVISTRGAHRLARQWPPVTGTGVP